MHRICEKMHNCIECCCLLSFMQVSVECVQCGLQRSLPDRIDSRDELWMLLQPYVEGLKAWKQMAVLICFTGAQVTVLSEPLIMWKENWLGEYMEMAYCSTLLPLENFVWANVLLKTRVVCKKESASLLLCYWKSMLIGVVPSVSFWERFWHL